MNLQTFTAQSMQDCLQQVKSAMGFNAVILHTRSYTKRRWLGLRKREFVEITAGRGLGGQQQSQQPTEHKRRQQAVLGVISSQLPARNTSTALMPFAAGAAAATQVSAPAQP